MKKPLRHYLSPSQRRAYYTRLFFKTMKERLSQVKDDAELSILFTTSLAASPMTDIQSLKEASLSLLYNSSLQKTLLKLNSKRIFSEKT